MPNDCTAPSLAVPLDEQSLLMPGIQYSIIMNNNMFRPNTKAKRSGKKPVLETPSKKASFRANMTIDREAPLAKPKARLDVYGAPVNTSNPVFLKAGPTTRVRHREMVTTLTIPTSTSFGSQLMWEQRLNPANSIMFPWLSKVARNYEKYTVHNVHIDLVSNNPTTTGGWIAAGIDRDSADPRPYSKQDLMNLGYARADAVWSGFNFDVPSDATVRFVDSNTTSPDQRLVDFGKLYLAGYSSTAGATVDVYISYEVSFFIPSSSFTTGQIINTSILWTSATWYTGGESFGPAYLGPSPLGAGHLQFAQPGQYLITTESEGTTMSAAAYTVAVGSNVSVAFSGGAENSTRAVYTWLVTVANGNNANSYIKYVPGAGVAITRSRLYITPVSSSEYANLS